MATFGYTSVPATQQTVGGTAAALYGIVYTLPENGDVTSISVYGKRGSAGTTNIKALIYSDSSSYPSALQGSPSNPTASSSTTAGWITMTFASPVSLTAGTWWIGFIIDNTGWIYYYDAGTTNQRYYSGSQNYASPPSTFPVGATGSARQFVYATYTPSSASSVKDIISSGIVAFAR